MFVSLKVNMNKNRSYSVNPIHVLKYAMLCVKSRKSITNIADYNFFLHTLGADLMKLLRLKFDESYERVYHRFTKYIENDKLGFEEILKKLCADTIVTNWYRIIVYVEMTALIMLKIEYHERANFVGVFYTHFNRQFKDWIEKNGGWQNLIDSHNNETSNVSPSERNIINLSSSHTSYKQQFTEMKYALGILAIMAILGGIVKAVIESI